MRPLWYFGAQNPDNIRPNLDSFRYDIEEGSARILQQDILNTMPFFQGFPDDFRRVVKQMTLIDAGEIQYFKLFCQYCLELDTKTEAFLPPDKRMCEFGDTAVIIFDYHEFLRRFIHAACLRFSGSCPLLLDRVSFYHSFENRQVDPIFTKNVSFVYQKELRLAFGIIGEDSHILEDKQDLLLKITPIRDIAIAVPIYRLLTLDFLKMPNFRLKLLPGSKNSLYRQIVKATRLTMQKYRSGPTLPLVSIY